jgi:hypothetical protein
MGLEVTAVGQKRLETNLGVRERLELVLVLYGAFGGKRGIFHRVFDQYCADALEAAARALTGPDHGALERLRRYIESGASASGGTPSVAA